MHKKMTEVAVDTAILDKRRGVIGSILLVLFVNLFFFKPFGWSGVATLLVGLWLYVLILLGGKVKRVAGIVGGSGILVIGVSIQMLFIADWVKLATLLLLGLFVVVTLYYHGLIERR
jgi:membrane-bound ClpP family serine protease